MLFPFSFRSKYLKTFPSLCLYHFFLPHSSKCRYCCCFAICMWKIQLCCSLRNIWNITWVNILRKSLDRQRRIFFFLTFFIFFFYSFFYSSTNSVEREWKLRTKDDIRNFVSINHCSRMLHFYVSHFHLFTEILTQLNCEMTKNCILKLF